MHDAAYELGYDSPESFHSDFGLDLPEVPVKQQFVRSIDVFVLGPAMIATAFGLMPQYRILKWALGTIGVLTTGYNAYNFVRIRELEKSREA